MALKRRRRASIWAALVCLAAAHGCERSVASDPPSQACSLDLGVAERATDTPIAPLESPRAFVCLGASSSEHLTVVEIQAEGRVGVSVSGPRGGPSADLRVFEAGEDGALGPELVLSGEPAWTSARALYLQGLSPGTTTLHVQAEGQSSCASELGVSVYALQGLHPAAGDFAPGRTGRVMISAEREQLTPDNNPYHTVVATTAAGTPAQTEDRALVVSARVTPTVAGAPVYFEVVDPDDASPYLEDETPGSVYRYHAEDFGVGELSSDARPGDNRQPQLNTQGGGRIAYESMQGPADRELGLDRRAARTVVVNRGEQRVAIAETRLGITPRFAGDNYIVRATCIDPRGRPFGAGSHVAPKVPTAEIPPQHVHETTLLTAWKRIYVEHDAMYRRGSFMTEAYPAGIDRRLLKVQHAGVFHEGDLVRVISLGRYDEAEVRAVLAVIPGAILVDRRLFLDHDEPPAAGFVGVELRAGDPTPATYRADLGDLADVLAPAYVELSQLPGTPVPLRVLDRNSWEAFRTVWFDHFGPGKGYGPAGKNVRHARGPAAGAENVIWLLGVDLGTDLVKTQPTSDALGFAAFWRKTSFVFVGAVESLYRSVPHRRTAGIRRVTAHEIVHQFQDQGLPGHDESRDYQGTARCLMAPKHEVDAGPGRLCVDHLYRIRDFPEPLIPHLEDFDPG